MFWPIFEGPPFVIMLGALGLQGRSNLGVWSWSVQTQGFAPCLPVSLKDTQTTLLKLRFSSMFS